MNYQIIVSENRENGVMLDIIVSKRRFNKLNRFKYLGGFSRYHINIFDDTNKKSTNKSKYKDEINSIFPELKSFSKLI